MGVDDGARAQKALEQSFLRHFERKDTYGFLVVDGGIFRDVHHERSLAHRGPRRQNHQIGLLESARHLIEVGEMRFEAGNSLATLHEGIDPTGIADGVANTLKSLPYALFGERKNR